MSTQNEELVNVYQETIVALALCHRVWLRALTIAVVSETLSKLYKTIGTRKGATFENHSSIHFGELIFTGTSRTHSCG